MIQPGREPPRPCDRDGVGHGLNQDWPRISTRLSRRESSSLFVAVFCRCPSLRCCSTVGSILVPMNEQGSLRESESERVILILAKRCYSLFLHK